LAKRHTFKPPAHAKGARQDESENFYVIVFAIDF
jgi:hypothetical protein